jgi:hypothetical protein
MSPFIPVCENVRDVFLLLDDISNEVAAVNAKSAAGLF